MTAALKSAVDRKEWMAVTVWEPSWMMQKYDLKFLKDPKRVFPPPQADYWIANKEFAKTYPHAKQLIASVYLPLDNITSMNSQVKDGKTMDQAVDAWVSQHAALFKRWTNVKND